MHWAPGITDNYCIGQPGHWVPWKIWLGDIVCEQNHFSTNKRDQVVALEITFTVVHIGRLSDDKIIPQGK